jgi:hypothetical protein
LAAFGTNLPAPVRARGRLPYRRPESRTQRVDRRNVTAERQHYEEIELAFGHAEAIVERQPPP